MINRRDFLRSTAVSIGGLGLTSTAFAKNPALIKAKRGKILVVVFQRGAMDGLSLLPPLGDSHYLEARPNIGLRASGDGAAIALDGTFGLHPALQSLKKYWDEGTLAFVPQSGSPNASRSHFDAQDFMEAGTSGEKNTQDGLLNRAMTLVAPAKPSPVRAVAMQPNMPRILSGGFPAISINSLQDFAIRTGAPGGSDQAAGFEAMYQQATDKVFRGVGSDVFDALKTVHQATATAPGKGKRADGDGRYAKSPIGNRLRQIAQLIHADVGLQLAVTDMLGWDTHVNQGGHVGQLAQRFKELADSIAAFLADLGPKRDDVVLLTVTEFGRTVKENGNRGTDHGHGSVMMVAGGPVVGKKVYGRWKELALANLFEERDVPVVTDFRDVLGELLQIHLGVSSLGSVFPKYDVDASKFLRLLR